MARVYTAAGSRIRQNSGLQNVAMPILRARFRRLIKLAEVDAFFSLFILQQF